MHTCRFSGLLVHVNLRDQTASLAHDATPAGRDHRKVYTKEKQKLEGSLEIWIDQVSLWRVFT
jgi:hypothetical protein